MRLHKARRLPIHKPNIAPLIDVVFLLIIFFLTVSHIAMVRVEALALPEATEGDKADALSAARVIININDASCITVAGQTHTLASLETLLDQEVQQQEHDQVSVFVRADRQVAWQLVSEVMQRCARRGIVQVQVAVIEPGR